MADNKNLHILRIKKITTLICLVFSLLISMQIFQIGPWTFQPGLKYPYLTYIGDPRYNLGISYGTPKACKLTLKYGESESNLNFSIKDNKVTNLHEFELKNLKADTKYYWKLTYSEEDKQIEYLDRMYSFRTAPDPSDRKPFKFTLVGDTRPDAFGFSAFPRLMELMLEEKPEFMINIGDIVMGPGVSYQWDRFFYDIRGCAEIGAPYMIGIGNHEWDEMAWLYGEDKGETYKHYMNYPHKESYYAFNYSNTAFISIDTNDEQMTDEQLNQVETWLNAANSSNIIDWIIVFGHYPVYTAEGYSNRLKDFEDLFEKYKVDLYLAGHIHHYARIEENNMTYIVSGGGGAELELLMQNQDNVKCSAITFEYNVLEIDGNKIKYEAISHAGQVFDKCTINSRRT
ncbi:MAG: metallophosphoesterase [Promethearchaeota archaeon]